MHPGKVMIPHIERSPHDTPTVEGDTPRERIEAGTATAGGILFSSGYPIQFAFRFRWIVNDRQRVQVTRVRLQSDFSIAEQVSDTFTHRHPLGLLLAIARDFLSDFQLLGIVDHGFDPKSRTMPGSRR